MFVISYKELKKIIEAFGYKEVPSKRSHAVYVNGSSQISIPKHKEISVGVIHQIARKLGLTVKELEVFR